MSKAFTPGPWILSSDETSAYRERNRPYIFVCALGRPLSERRANARLIAAAPDLYSWLDQMCNAYAALCEEFGQSHHRVPGSKYSHARDVLAKATPTTSGEER